MTTLEKKVLTYAIATKQKVDVSVEKYGMGVWGQIGKEKWDRYYVIDEDTRELCFFKQRDIIELSWNGGTNGIGPFDVTIYLK